MSTAPLLFETAKSPVSRKSLKKRSSGVLLHPTSLPGAYGVGDLGPEAFAFADFLEAAGQQWWQMLPICPVGSSGSPYQTFSSFAGNPQLISLQSVHRDGLLSKDDIQPDASLRKSNEADFRAAWEYKELRLRKAFITFSTKKRKPLRSAYERFLLESADWLHDYALFMAMKDRFGGVAWSEWPADIRSRKEESLRSALEFQSEEIGYQKFLQFLFFRQWARLKQHCQKRNIGFIGDIPFFVSPDSADVWANQDLFLLNSEGKPLFVAGVPPDYFSANGQLWGNVLYRWDANKKTGYDWWARRLRHSLTNFDAVRLDHFIGFHRYWEVPGQAKTARVGRYVDGPGDDFFEKITAKLGDVPLIAEDLGVVTPEVKMLRDKFHFPGMRVLQFAFGTDPEAGQYQPHNFPVNCVVYTGTHDNDTTVGWFNDHGGGTTRGAKDIKKELRVAMAYMNSDGKEIHWDMIRLALMSVAILAIVPLQDVLGLGADHRMNRPGIAEGNWKWRFQKNALTAAVAKRLRALTELYGRAGSRQK